MLHLSPIFASRSRSGSVSSLHVRAAGPPTASLVSFFIGYFQLRYGRSCQVCGASGRRKRFLLVHHRVPGKSSLSTLIALCRACHNKVHHTQAALSGMPPLLLTLWREQHPTGHEQTALDFSPRLRAVTPVPLFDSAPSC